MKRKFFQAALIVLSFLATIKILFFGLGIDEEYAVTMAFRMASGDRMFLDMWEPHQTSGFLAAGLVRIFLAVTGGTEYLVLYLRAAGALIQGLISVFLYRTLKRSFSADASFVAAVFFFNTLPKWIQTPEFSNMLVWFSVLMMLCFLRYYLGAARKKIWLVLAALSLCGLVLSYPSCILAVPVILVCMRMADGRGFWKDAGIVAVSCTAAGLLYVAYFLSHMSVPDFLFGLKQMMTDASHSAGVMERLGAYASEAVTLLPHALIPLGLAGLIVLIFRKVRSLPFFCLLVICLAQAEQCIIWLGPSRYIHFPLVYFYLLYGTGAALYLHVSSNGRGRRSAGSDAANVPRPLAVLFWMGTVTGGAVWLSGLLITNTTIAVTGSYLMTGLISAILIIGECGFSGTAVSVPTVSVPAGSVPGVSDDTDISADANAPASVNAPDSETRTAPLRLLYFLAALSLLGTTLFAKGFLMCENEGVKNNITYVRQKALSGPAKGIYYRYMEGYGYNSFASLVPQYIENGDSVLYVGQNTLFYVLCGQTISTYSTISTPAFDERLKEYWELHPKRYPDVVIVDTGYTGEARLDKLLKLNGPVAKAEGLEIYLTE